MASLQEQYNLIKEGKSTAKDVFLKHAKALFPQYIPNHFDFELTTKILKTKSIITEGYVDLTPSHNIQATPKQPYELAFEKFLQEAKKKEAEEKKIKADLKKTDKSVEDIQDKDYDQKDTKSIDNVIFDQLQRGVYTEMSKDPDQDLKKVKEKVLKNLTKDPIYYTKNSAFGLEIEGYTDKLPGANPSKTDKMEPVSKEKTKSNVQDSLGKKEAASKGKPKLVKDEMTQTSKTARGIKKMDMPGKEKVIKLKEGMGLADLLGEEEVEEIKVNDPKNTLFNFWKKGEIEVGNETANVESPEELQGETKDTFNRFVDLVNNYPKIDKEDLAVLNSIGLFGGTETFYNSYEWNNLKEKDFIKIMMHEYGYEREDVDEDYENLDETLEEGPLEDADAKLAKDQAAKEAEAAAIEKQRADNKLKIANANKNV